MSELEKEIIVSKEEEGMRLDIFLSEHLLSRSQAEKLIKKNLIKRKNLSPITKPSHKVRAGETYLVCINPQKKEVTLKPYNLEIPILYQDQDILVINKPAGLVVHPGPGHEQDTLVNALIGKVSLSPGVETLRPGIVHRLDKDVSGLMILTRTKEAQAQIIQQFKDRKITRLYRALAIGSPQKTKGRVETFIGRHRKDRQKQASFDTEVVGSRWAATCYQILESFSTIHHVELQLETGRTHQIRVHLTSLGLPILGEAIYAKPRSQKKLLTYLSLDPSILFIGRLALYSAFLKFTHPITAKELSFSLPWPSEFSSFMKNLSFDTRKILF